MKLIELIDKYVEQSAKVFVNGMPETDGGRIIKREEDFIRFEITKNGAKQEETAKETVIIPISQINTISQGERKAGVLSVSN
ncbi:MAG: hypothetical protein V1859_02335 [archaeon]